VKKLIPVLAMIMLVPFVICSCFVQQAKSMKLSYEEIEFHVGDSVIIVITKHNFERSMIYGRILSKW